MVELGNWIDLLEVHFEHVNKWDGQACTVGLRCEVIITESAARDDPRADQAFDINRIFLTKTEKSEKVR